MKKTIKYLPILILILFCFIYTYDFNENSKILKGSFNNQKEINTDNALALMYEIDAGSGEYQTSSDTTWPEEGYVFNATLSKCENGGTVSWNEETKSVIVKTNVSDKCYIYFDKCLPFKVYNINNSGFTIEIDDSTVSRARYSLKLGDFSYTYEVLSSVYDANNLFADSEYELSVDIMYKNGILKTWNMIIKTLPNPNLSSYCSPGEIFSDCIKNNYEKMDKIYFHDENLDYSAQDYSYRFSGDNPNNYVCFGSDSNECPYNNLYRIIGVFDNKLKIIKADFATSEILGINGNYSNEESLIYNENFSRSEISSNILKTSGYYYEIVEEGHSPIRNLWSDSDLNLINLNQNYLNSLSAEWQEKIVFNSWFGLNAIDYSITAKEMYDLERLRPAQSNNKIGLMYASDYAFATEKEKWNYSVSESSAAFIYYFTTGEYKVAEAIDGNWLYVSPGEGLINNTYLRQYLTIQDEGFLIPNSGNAVLTRPCFYLADDVTFQGGKGTKDNPYRLS